MKSIIALFWGICLLRQSPAAVPGAGAFLIWVFVVNITTRALVSITIGAGRPLVDIASSIIIGQAITAALVKVMLDAKRFGDRLTTTLAALFGCDTVITACFGLLSPFFGLFGASGALFGFSLFLAWSIAVMGFILHRALAVSIGIGLGLALATSLIGVTVSQVALGN